MTAMSHWDRTVLVAAAMDRGKVLCSFIDIVVDGPLMTEENSREVLAGLAVGVNACLEELHARGYIVCEEYP